MLLKHKTWQDYSGEDIVKSVFYQNGQQVIDKVRYEKLPYEPSDCGIAIVLGNGPTREKLSVTDYYNNNGGLRNKWKAEVYGCNAVYRDGKVHHLIINNWPLLEDALEKKIYNTSRIYTHQSFWLKANDPENVHLVTQKVIADTGTMALYMACFHGNKTVYFTGLDSDLHPNKNIYENTPEYPIVTNLDQSKFLESQADVMRHYKDVKFIRVVANLGMSRGSPWPALKNFQEITFDQFIDIADIGLITYEGYQQARGLRKY